MLLSCSAGQLRADEECHANVSNIPILQALWDKASPLLQLPHVEEDMLKHFYSKRRNIKSLAQLAKMSDEDRRLLLRGLAEEQYKDLVKVILKLFAQQILTIS